MYLKFQIDLEKLSKSKRDSNINSEAEWSELMKVVEASLGCLTVPQLPIVSGTKRPFPGAQLAPVLPLSTECSPSKMARYAPPTTKTESALTRWTQGDVQKWLQEQQLHVLLIPYVSWQILII